MGGAISCVSCPETNLTDFDNKPVVAITSITGATSAAACYIGSNVYFKDGKGTYHFKSNCEHQGGYASNMSAEGACLRDPACEWQEGMDDPSLVFMCNNSSYWMYNPDLGIGYCSDETWVMDPPTVSCDWTGGTWDWPNKTCNCPEGTSWQSDGTDMLCL